MDDTVRKFKLKAKLRFLIKKLYARPGYLFLLKKLYKRPGIRKHPHEDVHNFGKCICNP